MQRISVYLHKETIAVLKCFGELNHVVNKLLSECLNTGKVFETIIPSAPDRRDARRIILYIDDNIFDELNASKLKIRSVIYWFIENEVYNEFEWVVIHEYGEELREREHKLVLKILSDLNRLSTLSERPVSRIIDAMREMYET